MNRTEELFQRWQDGSLSEDEILELKQLLSTAPARAQLVQDFLTIAAITDEFKEAADSSECGLEEAASAGDLLPFPRVRQNPSTDCQPAVDPPGQQANRRWNRARQRWMGILSPVVQRRAKCAGAVLAVLSLCVLGAGIWLVFRDEPSRANLARVEGEVAVLRGKQQLRAEAGLALQDGDVIQTSRRSQAVVQYQSETTLVKLAEESDAMISGGRLGKRLELTRGSLEAEVAPQPRFRPMIVATPNAIIKVLGTRFLLQTTDVTTRLEVIEGLVRLSGRKDDASVNVSTAHHAELSPRHPLRAIPKGEIVINFGPDSLGLPAGILNDSGEEFSPGRGYGWEGPKNNGTLRGEFIEYQGRLTGAIRGRKATIRTARRVRADVLHASFIEAGWINHTQKWKMRLAPGRYLVTVCAGDPESPQGPLHVRLQDRQVIDAVFTREGEFCEIQDIPIDVKEDGFLKLVVGGYSGQEKMPDGSSDTTLNFLVIKRVENASSGL